MYIKQKLNLILCFICLVTQDRGQSSFWGTEEPQNGTASSWAWIYTQGSMRGCLCSSSDKKKREGDHLSVI